MGGATSVMPVIRDAFNQQAADTTQWTDTIIERTHTNWLPVVSSRIMKIFIHQRWQIDTKEKQNKYKYKESL